MGLSVQFDRQRNRLFFGFLTENEISIQKARQRGFKIYERGKGNYLCAAPEISLFDLSNLILPFQFEVEEIWELWKNLETRKDEFVQKVLERYGCQIAIFKGPFRDCQYRLACEEREKTTHAKNYVLEQALGRSVHSENTWYGPGLISNQSLENASGSTRHCLLELQTAYRTTHLPGLEHGFPLYSVHEIVIHRVWKDIYLFSNRKPIIFNLHDGVPYALGFIETIASDISNIAFVEMHIGGDPYRSFRDKTININEWEFPKPIPHGGIVIDRSISGNTLRRLKERVKASCTIALCPKSLDAVRQANYVVFNGYLFKVSSEWLNDEWYLEKAKETLARWERDFVHDKDK